MTSKTTLPLYLTATAASLFGNSAIAIVLPWLVLAGVRGTRRDRPRAADRGPGAD